MSCLVEVHKEAEVEVALKSGARIIGINNRDIKTLKVDVTTTERLRPLIPPDRIVVSKIENDGIVMTRPVYPYPRTAIYDGVGDPNIESSFVEKK